MCDLEDKDFVESHTWYENDLGYICSRDSDKKIIKFHRAILGLKNENKGNVHNVVDHIDGNTLNNTKDNLRICEQLDNMKNICMRKNNKTGYMGVSYIERINKFQAYITSDKKHYNLGIYSDIEDAIAARKNAELKFGFNIREKGAPND